MPTITTNDGTQIYYKDWGIGQPLLFSHGWPLSADAGESWNGNDMDTYADDSAELVEMLDLHDAIHVGAPAGTLVYEVQEDEGVVRIRA